jgi:plastocyanin
MYRGLHGSRMLRGALICACLVGASAPAAAGKRFFTIAAGEPKGGTTSDKEPFPAAALPEGGGYVIKKPDQTGRWEVSAYVWQPSQIIVTEGDEVTLEFIGINGAEHPTTVVGYDKTLVLKRGHVIRLELKADKPGTFPIVCSHHKPSMVGELIVMPKK